MARFLAKRLMEGLFVLVVASLLVFVGVFEIGDPVTLLVPPQADQATVESVRASLGLNLPIYEQYLRFMANALHGDLGLSFVYRESALKVILERLPATLELATAAMMIAGGIGIPLGILVGTHPDGWIDRLITAGATLGSSLPTFWVGMLLILLFSVHLGWLPTSGRGETVALLGVRVSFLTLDGLRHLVLPAFNLSLFPMAFIVRLTRSGTREALGLDFVRFARAQGNTPGQVIRFYVLKFISIPLVTIVGLYFGILIAFSVVTESVFAWPGLGKLIVDSINLLDRPVIVAYIMLTVLIVTAINITVDIVYSVLDPRVRTE